MHLHVWQWIAVICLVAGIPYCFWPLAEDRWYRRRRRQQIKRAMREIEARRQRGDFLSSRWVMEHRGTTDGDKVA